MRNQKEALRLKRHRRIVLKIHGTGDRPRLAIRRTLKNLHGQLIDDTQNKTIFSLSTQDKEIRQKFPSAGNIKTAMAFGEVFAQKAREKNITKVVFDRAGYLYHGRIKAFADALRKGGLKF